MARGIGGTRRPGVSGRFGTVWQRGDVARRLIVVFAVALLAAVAWPAVRGPEHDSFPFSSYPMFARPRPPVVQLVTAVAIGRDGAERRLGPSTIGGTPEPVHASVVLGRAVATGRGDVFCAEVAARLAAGDDGREAVAVELVRLTIDLIGWYADKREPDARDVLARCPVPAAA